MRPSLLAFAGVVLASVSSVASAGQSPAKPRDLAALNPCELVPGSAIANAVGGKLLQATPFDGKSFTRCTYILERAPGGQRAGYVVYLQAAGDFEELKQYIEDPLTPLTGLGDGAYMFHDRGDGRFKINVLKKGDLMFQATGDSAESARKVADAVVKALGKRP
jgi:hypothetical protein